MTNGPLACRSTPATIATMDDRGPRRTRRPLIALVAGLAGGLAAVVVLLAAIGGGAGRATSPPSAVATPTAQGGATPAPSDVIAERVAEVERQVPPIRGLSPTADVPTRIIDRERLRTELRAIYEQEAVAQQYRVVGDLYERLGLLPAATDLRQLVLDVNGAGVSGVYFPEEKEMVVVTARGLDATARITLAHEFTHALQDQHFGLDELGIDDVGQSDRGLARLALVEGDATQLMVEWAAAHLSPLELLSIVVGALTPEQQELLQDMPPVLRRQLTFPYVDGQAFVATIKASGGWPAVDDAYSDPPDSTEQVLHPGAYAAREAPIAVQLPDLEAALGEGWTSVLEDTMGELTSQIWLEQASGSTEPDPTPSALSAAAGWGGDRIASYDGPGASWAVAWQTAWDTPADAAEFRTAAAAALRGSPGTTALLGEGGDTVIVLFASDADALDRLRAPFESI